jgi:hypothetical protein
MSTSPRGKIVIPGFMPGIQPSAAAAARGKMDPGDEHRDDTLMLALASSYQHKLICGRSMSQQP